jgi:site-specific recombinase XerD
MAHLGEKFPAEVLTRKEVTSLLTAFPPSKTGVRNRALIAVYLYAQLRCNEALDLRPADISRDRCSITVLSGKGGKRRVAGIPGEILDTYVQPWLEVRPASTYVFCSHKGKRLGDAYIRRMLKRAADRARISHRVHVHGLRHTGAFNLAEQGVDLRDIQRQLGHTSLAVTDRYINHLGAEERVARVGAVTW